jgi:hypothetical protein
MRRLVGDIDDTALRAAERLEAREPDHPRLASLDDDIATRSANTW